MVRFGDNRRGLVAHNASPYTSIGFREKLQELDWEILMRPPYTCSLDMASSDCYLFLFTANDLVGKKFASRDALKIDCPSFLAIWRML